MAHTCGCHVLLRVLCHIPRRWEPVVFTAGAAVWPWSRLGYALQSIFASIAVRKGYTSLTVNFYISLFAAAGAILLVRGQMAELSPLPSEAVLLVAAAGSIASFLPSWLYVKSLSAMEASRASVMASTEPIAATAFGVVLFNDPLGPAIIVGAVLILAAVAISARPDPHPPLDKHPPA